MAGVQAGVFYIHADAPKHNCLEPAADGEEDFAVAGVAD